MTALTIRRLLVDLDKPPARHWNGGDAFRTALFNALSFSFPAGEQFFIDSIRLGLARLSPEVRARFDDEARGFIGQEATHRRVHERFNAHLAAQGLVNHWDTRIRQRARALEGVDPRIWVGVTAATEHFTAVLAEYLLTHPQALEGSAAAWRDLWLWHASEESEHRSTAFDLYRQLGGDERWRRRLFWIVSWHFATDLARQTLHNLWRDGTWRRPSTWLGAWRLLFGSGALVRHGFGLWRRYLRPDFHPDQGDGRPGAAWLAGHTDLAPPVQAAAPRP